MESQISSVLAAYIMLVEQLKAMLAEYISLLIKSKRHEVNSVMLTPLPWIQENDVLDPYFALVALWYF